MPLITMAGGLRILLKARRNCFRRTRDKKQQNKAEVKAGWSLNCSTAHCQQVNSAEPMSTREMMRTAAMMVLGL